MYKTEKFFDAKLTFFLCKISDLSQANADSGLILAKYQNFQGFCMYLDHEFWFKIDGLIQNGFGLPTLIFLPGNRILRGHKSFCQ